MKFEDHRFSKRFPPVNCALFVIHEPSVAGKAFIEYDPAKGIPNVRAMQYRGTAAAIILPDGRFWVGVCLCAPMDQFVKKIGRQKAIGRAYVALRKGCAVNDGCLVHGIATIVYAIAGVPLSEPRFEDAAGLKSELQEHINEAKKKVGIL